jgi:hypothetical protein
MPDASAGLWIAPTGTAALVLLGLTLLLRALGEWQRAALVRRLPITPLRELSDGLARVRGKVDTREQALTAPWSGAPCVYYALHLERWGRQGKRDGWIPVVDEELDLAVVIDDGSGTTLDLELEGFTLHLADDVKRRNARLKHGDPRLTELVERYGQDPTALLDRSDLKVTETALEVGTEVTVVGEAERIGDGWRLLPTGPLALLSDQGDTGVQDALKGLSGRSLVSAAVALAAAAGWTAMFLADIKQFFGS